jgi:hypothetical protein
MGFANQNRWDNEIGCFSILMSDVSFFFWKDNLKPCTAFSAIKRTSHTEKRVDGEGGDCVTNSFELVNVTSFITYYSSIYKPKETQVWRWDTSISGPQNQRWLDHKFGVVVSGSSTALPFASLCFRIRLVVGICALHQWDSLFLLQAFAAEVSSWGPGGQLAMERK